MADLIGTASIRIDMPTAGAARSVRQFAARVDNQLRGVQQRVAATARDLSRLRGTSVGIAVNDQTAAGIASVRAAVNDLQRLGPVRIPVQINDGTRRGARTVQTTVAQLQRLGPVRIDTSVDVDPAAIANAASALRGLQDAARGAARALGTLTTRATAATAALVALGAAAQSLRGDMDNLDGSIRRTGSGMTGLRGRLGTITTSASSAGSAMRGLKTAALLLAPALIPIAAQALPIAAGLTAATVAVTAFAVAAAGQISSISEAAEAEKKYEDAVKEHGAASQQAATAQQAFRRAVDDMPHPTRVAAGALSNLKDQYRQWSDSLAASTMPAATQSFALFGALFPKLTPVVEGAGAQLRRFTTIAAGGVQSAGFDRFMRSFAEFSTGAMSKANDALIRFTRTLDTGKVSGGVAQFMEYARENGPLVRDTFAKLGEALGNLLEGAANAGPGLLTVVNALAGLVAAVPPGVITVLLQLAVAMKAVAVASALMAAAQLRLAAFGTAITAMTTAAAGATGVLPRLAAAFGVLSRAAKVALVGTGIGLLVIALSELAQIGRKAPPDVDKMTTSLGKLAQTGKLSGEAARVFGTDFKGLGDALRTLARPSNLDKVQQSLTSLIGMDSTPVKDAKEAFDGLDEGLTALVKGGKAEIAAEALKVSVANLKEQGFTADEVRGQLDGYKAALADQAFEQEVAARAMGLFGQQAQATSAKLAEQKQSADGLRQAIQALNDVNRSALGGQIAFDASIDAATKAAQENAGALRMVNGVLDTNSPKAQAAATALQDLASKTDEAAAANRESTGSWQGAIGIYERGRQQLVKNAMQMGLTRDEAQKLASQILNTPNKTAMLKADITDWKTKIGEAEKQLKTAKGDKKAKLTADIADWRAKVAAAELQLKGAKADKRAKLTADIADWRAKVANAERQLRTAKGDKKARLTANIADWQSKIGSAQRQINSLPRSRSTTLTVRTINEIITRSKTFRSVHDIVGATGGLYTGSGFKHRGKGYARGGLVDGPGTETSDSVMAPWLSKNEFVVNAKQTAKHLPLLKAINDGQFGTAGPGMAGAGAAVGAGLASGMAAATKTVEAAARAMATAVTTGVREELQIASPSRAMKALAKDVGAGFISGLTGSRDKIKSVSKDLAADVRAAFSGRRESSLIKMINRDTDKLTTLASKRDSVTKKIADARAFSTGTASKAAATGSLGSIVQNDYYAPSFVEKRMKASLASIKAFTSNVQKLQKKGASKTLLRQVLDLGVEQGGGFAKSLAGADAATIKRYNKLQADISGQSKRLGNAGADMLYDSGRKAGAGFLTGLKAQQQSIEKLMLSIAKGMQKSIRRALGIKSPSTVFAAIGRNVGDGLAAGLSASRPKVTEAAKRLSSAAAVTAKKAAAGRRAGGSSAGSAPKTGYGAAVAELQRLVDSGRWRKSGSMLFEDVSFQGMSKNFQRQQMKVADGFWAAIGEIKKAVRSGKKVFEDMTFKGMSANVNRFHDMIAQVWKGNPYGRNFGDWGNFGAYGRYGKYASGGTPRKGEVAMVGERGPELVLFGQAARVVDAATTKAMHLGVSSMRTSGRAPATTGGDVHLHIHNDGVIGSQIELDNWLTGSLDRLARTRRLPANVGSR